MAAPAGAAASPRRAIIDDNSLELALRAGEAPFALPPAVRHRLETVLRLPDGAVVEVFDRGGAVARGRLVDGHLHALVRVEVTDPLPPLVLLQATTRTDKLEEVAQRACELGASGLVLWDAARSQVKVDAERAAKRQERLQRIADDAARQAGRPRPCLVQGPLSASAATAFVQGFAGLCVAGVLVDDDTPLLSTVLALHRERIAQDGVLVVVGPEGGLHPDETRALTEAGAVAVRWSPWVLRTETAGLGALAVIHAALGVA